MNRETSTVWFGHRNIDFRVVRSRIRKTVSIFVDPLEGVFLRAPEKFSGDSLARLVRSKAGWILGKQRRLQEITEQYPPKEFMTGETFLYLGNQFRLKVIYSPDQPKTGIQKGRLIVEINKLNDDYQTKKIIRKLLTIWYKKQARIILTKRINNYVSEVGVNVPQIILANQNKRWGSCNGTNKVRLNWHIIMAPLSLIDYVVVHELCHFREHNHTDNFWRLLGSIIPDYENRKEHLSREGTKYFWF